MTARELFDAIGAMDDDLVLAADEEPLRRRRSWKPVVYRVLPLAACFCLVVGAVLWRGQQGASGGTAPDTAMMEAAPNEDPTTAAAAPPDAAARSDETEESTGSAADKRQTVDEFSAAVNALGVSAFPSDLADLLDTGSGTYTMSAEPSPADRGDPADTLLPDTVPVYASMASSQTIDTSGMYGRLQSMLQALGLDTALADEAVYTGLSQEEAEKQADTLQQNGGSAGDALRLWSCAAELTLEVAPSETWPQGLTITAESNGTVTARAPGTETAAAPLQENAADAAEAVLTAWPEIVALAGQDPTAQTYTGTDGEWHARFYDAADNSCRGIESGDLRSVEVALDENGSLCLVVWRNADLNTAVGEYATVTRQEADELLTQNLFLTDGGSLDGSAVLENLVDLRLVYSNSRAGAWYLPYWCYTADEGPSGEDGSLHVYSEYLVPAVSLEDLQTLAGTE